MNRVVAYRAAVACATTGARVATMGAARRRVVSAIRLNIFGFWFWFMVLGVCFVEECGFGWMAISNLVLIVCCIVFRGLNFVNL